MKKVMHLLIATIMAIVFVESSLTNGVAYTSVPLARVEEPLFEDVFEYEINDDGTSVTIIHIDDSEYIDYNWYGFVAAEELVIPTTLGGMKVTNIGDNSFENFHGRRVVIPDGVISIGANAFKNSSNLEEIVIPPSVSFFGASAFRGTAWLDTKMKKDHIVVVNRILIAAGYIGTDLVIPDGVTCIGDGALRDKIGLYSVTIPEGVARIGDFAFYNCTSLETISIPSSLTSFGQSAFHSTPWFRDAPDMMIINNVLVYVKNCDESYVVIPNTVTKIEDGAFGLCDDMDYGPSEVILPDGLISIGDGAFACLYWLDSITIPDGTRSIGERAFIQCGLRQITIPDSVTSIGENAFKSCPYDYYSQSSSNSMVIRGFLGSYAEQYATDRLLPFVGLGDVDDNRSVSISDAVRLLRWISESKSTEDTESYVFNAQSADWDGDEVITMLDASYLLKYLEKQDVRI